MKYVKYPELQGWYKEGLFQRRQFGGEYWSVGKQMWYVNKLREIYFANNGMGCIWNVGNVGRGMDIPFTERSGWIKAKIKDGFKHISNPDMRYPMMAMILTGVHPLPKAHDISDECLFAWEQFKYDFAKGLMELHEAKVGYNV